MANPCNVNDAGMLLKKNILEKFVKRTAKLTLIPIAIFSRLLASR
jgi:hypothetical protein